jgi:hypothetical protein
VWFNARRVGQAGIRSRKVLAEALRKNGFLQILPVIPTLKRDGKEVLGVQVMDSAFLHFREVGLKETDFGF